MFSKAVSKTVTKQKEDDKLPPGSIRAVTIEMSANGGASVRYDRVPEEKAKKSMEMGFYNPPAPHTFSTVAEAFHSAAKECGVDADLEEQEEAGEKEPANA